MVESGDLDVELKLLIAWVSPESVEVECGGVNCGR